MATIGVWNCTYMSPMMLCVTAPGVAPPAEDPANPQRALFSGAPDERPPHVWRWVLGSAFAALCIGFALGALTLDRHIRRKYGGLRIY